MSALRTFERSCVASADLHTGGATLVIAIEARDDATVYAAALRAAAALTEALAGVPRLAFPYVASHMARRYVSQVCLESAGAIEPAVLSLVADTLEAQGYRADDVRALVQR